MDKQAKVILKVLVGSHAHGLADKDSDMDYRAVYVLPTERILSLNYKYKGTDWVEGNVDNTSYEIGHFLHLATKCNPTILEVFKAPVIKSNEDGDRLRQIFSWLWEPNCVFNAFLGYGLNQRKKFLDKKDNRQNKYACAYIRTLYACYELLSTETFSMKVADENVELLRNFRRGEYEMGDVINIAERLRDKCEVALAHCKHQNNINAVNDFLVEIRKKYFNCC